MAESVLLVERREGIATLTLNRPEALNALSGELMRCLARAFLELQGDDSIGAVIVTGAGRAFCAGMDLVELGSTSGGERGDKIGNPLDPAMRAFDRPIIAAVNGHAVTAGFELALACDVIVASTAARFVDSHARVGILPGWGLSVKLPRLIGSVRAKAASLTGNPISAEEAERWGLAARLVEPDALLSSCRALAADMLSCDREILRGYKRLIDECFGMHVAAALPYETAVATVSAQRMSADRIAARREGVQQRNRERA
jgi:enoyl-CoA hydratase